MKILITNGRSPITLDFVRNLAEAGHEIYVAETEYLHYCRFSNTVQKNFFVPSPKQSRQGYIDALVAIIEQHNIEMCIPTWEDSLLISKHIDQFPARCSVFVGETRLLHALHNKWSFIAYLKTLGIPTPRTEVITSLEELDQIDMRDYALKACFSRGSNQVYRISKGTPMPSIVPTEDDPWVAQEWLEGANYCTYSVCREGVVHAHAVYPVDFVLKQKTKLTATVGSYCLTFRSVEHPGILEWTKNFVQKTNYTGQLAFDFIELPNGVLYAIECNPRITSGVTLFSTEDNLDQAFLGTNKELITPHPDYKRQIAMGMLLYGWQTAIATNALKRYFYQVFTAKDLVFNLRDMKPFFAQAILYLKFMKDAYKYNKRLPAAFTHTLDYHPDE